MPTTLTLTPAYGRDYTSKKQVLTDWNGNRDFRIATLGPNDGRYTSKRDLEAFKREGVRWLNIRYRRLTQICVIDLAKA